MAALHSVMALIAVMAPVANAGFALPVGVAQSTSLNAGNTLRASVESMFLEDAWVDTQITAPAPSPCKSLDECGWNRSDWNRSMVAYADIASSKRLLLSDFEHATNSEEQVMLEHRQILEASAVQLSLLLQRSCTEVGYRQCWRKPLHVGTGTSEGPRELRPVTITFRESLDVRDMRRSLTAPPVPLITSLKHFRLNSA